MRTEKKLAVLNTKDVSKLFKVHEQTVREWAKEGAIPAKKVGQNWFFNLETITTFLEDRSIGTESL